MKENDVELMTDWELKKLKETILKRPNYAESTDAKHIINLINMLSVKNKYIDICPILDLTTINDILSSKDKDFALVNLSLDETREGSMAMEYYYTIIIKKIGVMNELYGINFDDVELIDGEMWDDYVANEGDRFFDLKKVKVEQEIKTVYHMEE
jgi:hypothetical protein